MTFVQVKENEWLDLDRKILMRVVRASHADALFYIHIQSLGHDVANDFTFEFPTLEEAIAAQKRIIESCKEQIKINAYNPFQEIVDMIPNHLKEK